MRVGIRELRQHASRYVDLVRNGQTVEVTDRGELVALLVPPRPAQTARDRLVAAGRLVPAPSPTGRLRSGRAVAVGSGEPSNEELLEATRDERL